MFFRARSLRRHLRSNRLWLRLRFRSGYGLRSRLRFRPGLRFRLGLGYRLGRGLGSRLRLWLWFRSGRGYRCGGGLRFRRRLRFGHGFRSRLWLRSGRRYRLERGLRLRCRLRLGYGLGSRFGLWLRSWRRRRNRLGRGLRLRFRLRLGYGVGSRFRLRFRFRSGRGYSFRCGLRFRYGFRCRFWRRFRLRLRGSRGNRLWLSTSQIGEHVCNRVEAIVRTGFHRFIYEVGKLEGDVVGIIYSCIFDFLGKGRILSHDHPVENGSERIYVCLDSGRTVRFITFRRIIWVGLSGSSVGKHRNGEISNHRHPRKSDCNRLRRKVKQRLAGGMYFLSRFGNASENIFGTFRRHAFSHCKRVKGRSLGFDCDEGSGGAFGESIDDYSQRRIADRRKNARFLQKRFRISCKLILQPVNAYFLAGGTQTS